MTYVYVLMASLNDKRIPLAVFSNRERAEDSVATELERELSAFGLHMGDCDNFIVEEWHINSFLKEKTSRTLTAYDAKGTLTKRIVDLGSEGVEDKPSRFARLIKEPL